MSILSKVLPLDRNGRSLKSICQSSGYLTVDGQITLSPAILMHVEVISDGVNPVTAIIYDGTGVDGTALFHAYASASDIIGGGLNLSIEAPNGLYLDLSGAGAKVIMHYIEYS